jgi:PAS domain S-box-containing protein
VENNDTIILNAKDITKEHSFDEVMGEFIIFTKLNKDGAIIEISDMFCSISGYEEGELIGKDYQDLILTKDGKKIVFEHLLQNEETHFEIQFKSKSDEIFWLNSIIKPIYNKYGDIEGYYIISFDITDKVKLQSYSDELEIKINEAVEKNRKKDQLIFNQSKFAIMGEILTTMSHHWRQPLNSISLKSQNLALKYELGVEVTSEFATNILEEIEAEADGLSQILYEFQESVSLKDDGVKKNIETILVEAKNIIDNNPLHTKIHFFQNFFDVRDDEIFPAEFVNVLVNIMINSLEAFKKSKLEEPVIDLNLSCDDEYAYMEIIDNGGGISEDILPKVFEPYFSTKDERNGTGLGLYMSKNIIELKMMGTIEISTISNHTKVFIQIPFVQNIPNPQNEKESQ